VAGKLTELFSKLGHFNGVVLVADKGEVLYKQAFGFSNRERNERMDVDAVFEIASISKTFTAVAVHKLVERGALRLDDSLTRFFPELPYHGVTLRGLLSHTSGLFDVYGDVALRKRFYDFYGKTEPAYTNKDYLAFLEAFKPDSAWKPGERTRYSNTGYVLLALIVEKASGQAFDVFLRENIFEPAGMKKTFVYSLMKDRRVPGLASGYRREPYDGIVPDPDPDAGPRIHGLTYGDDEIVSTVGDLLAFDRALRCGKLLKPETLERALVPPILAGGGISDYALGFRVFTEEGRRYVSHGGGTAGFRSWCKFSRPDNDTTVILFTNVTTPSRIAFRAIHEAICRILRGQVPSLFRLTAPGQSGAR